MSSYIFRIEIFYCFHLIKQMIPDTLRLYYPDGRTEGQQKAI